MRSGFKPSSPLIITLQTSKLCTIKERIELGPGNGLEIEPLCHKWVTVPCPVFIFGGVLLCVELIFKRHGTEAVGIKNPPSLRKALDLATD